jgi:hypothetical protein
MRVMVLAVLVALARPLGAQSTAAPDSTAVVIDSAVAAHRDRLVPLLDYEFSAPGEYVRLFLAGGVVYRARVSSADVDLVLTAVLPATIPPTVIELDRFGDATGERNFLIRPGVDGEYEFRAPVNTALDTVSNGVPVAPAGGSTRLLLYRDARETARWASTGTQPWALGIAIAGGAGGSYPVSATATPTGSSGIVEGCLEVRYGPGIGRWLSGCVLGVSHESRPGASQIYWVYMEPRFRVFGVGRAWGQRLDAGLLFRAGFGEVEGVNQQPGMVAPGAYVSVLLFHQPHWPRLVLGASARYAYIVSGSQPTQAAAQGTLGIGLF